MQTGGGNVGIGRNCGSYSVTTSIGLDVERLEFFDGKTGKLAAVMSYFLSGRREVCLAGPTEFVAPTISEYGGIQCGTSEPLICPDSGSKILRDQ